MIADFQQREQALDCTQSFIVQAPAGSGKTELLIQRYLALLATVEKVPEQIVAITFTRKAAQEMRMRIMHALTRAANEPEPHLPHLQKTWALAQAALARDKKENWQLLKQPNRLAVQTIDGFCARLTRQMPLLSRLGAMPEITEDAYTYYEQAAEQIWLSLSRQAQWMRPIKNLLMYMDNQLPRLQRLIANLLAQREQWLDYVGQTQNPEQLASILQQHLQQLISDVLQQTYVQFPEKLQNMCADLYGFARGQCIQNNIANDALTNCTAFPHFPAANVSTLAQWQALTTLLLTKEGELRKTVNKNVGFPAKTDGKTPAEKAEFDYRKKTMLQLLIDLKEHPQLLERLAQVQQLPEATYSAEKQQILIDLLEVLALAVAQLMVLFQQNGVSDFNQLLQGALQALGTPEQPSDLALALDYRIQHILVDEFQDTSVAQFRLIERLTAGWMSGDGRSLFLVGDPMQSIYRFRQAEVGLFLSAWENGIGSVALTPLTLRVNFRSANKIIDWINLHMAAAFPAFPDIGVGAVPFSPSIAVHQHSNAKVNTHTLPDTTQEAQTVVELIQNALADPTQEMIAILVRARSHLREILPLLQKEKITYQAVEIETLSTRSVLQDLLALTRALLHPADRIAWLAILRAPWCGLTLVDLTYLIKPQPDACILDNLSRINDWSTFSEHAQQTLPHFIQVMQESVEQRQRLPVCQWVLNTWLALDGPTFYADETTLADADLFFNLLEEINLEAYTLLPEEWDTRLASLYATPTTTQSRVQIMTMHKAKGLEFDTVIIPGLHTGNNRNIKPLLAWWERPRQDNSTEVLIAPLHAAGSEEDKLYQYIWTQQQKAMELEITRLLYVAVTRAKTYLHLVGVLEVNEETGEQMLPSSTSLFNKIWQSES